MPDDHYRGADTGDNWRCRLGRLPQERGVRAQHHLGLTSSRHDRSLRAPNLLRRTAGRDLRHVGDCVVLDRRAARQLCQGSPQRPGAPGGRHPPRRGSAGADHVVHELRSRAPAASRSAQMTSTAREGGTESTNVTRATAALAVR